YWVHGIFEDLEPIARIEVFAARDESIARATEAVVERKGWPLLWRTHVREHDAVVLVDRIGAVAEPILERARRWLARSFEDRAVHVEEPAVVAAADSSLGDQAELQ